MTNAPAKPTRFPYRNSIGPTYGTSFRLASAGVHFLGVDLFES